MPVAAVMWKTKGLTDASGQWSTAKVPQLGTKVILFSASVPELSGGVEVFEM